MTEDKIAPTWMSEVLEVPDKEDGRDWHLVVTLSPGTRHSPHYRYHGARHHVATAERLFREYDVPRDRKHRLAEAIRQSWKETHGDRESRQLVHTLCEEAAVGKYAKTAE